MPTGYTAKLMEKGQSFPDFVMTCAHAFGACVLMREEPLDTPIPEFKPSTYHLKALEEAKAERARLLAMTDRQKIAFGQVAKTKSLKQNEEWLAKELAENSRLLAIRDQVKAWEPPTSEHVELKKFMLQQIEISLNKPEYIEQEIIKTKASFARDYYDAALCAATRDIEYHTKEYREENERTAGRNRWVRELRANLGEEKA